MYTYNVYLYICILICIYSQNEYLIYINVYDFNHNIVIIKITSSSSLQFVSFHTVNICE